MEPSHNLASAQPSGKKFPNIKHSWSEEINSFNQGAYHINKPGDSSFLWLIFPYDDRTVCSLDTPTLTHDEIIHYRHLIIKWKHYCNCECVEPKSSSNRSVKSVQSSLCEEWTLGYISWCVLRWPLEPRWVGVYVSKFHDVIG